MAIETWPRWTKERSGCSAWRTGHRRPTTPTKTECELLQHCCHSFLAALLLCYTFFFNRTAALSTFVFISTAAFSYIRFQQHCCFILDSFFSSTATFSYIRFQQPSCLLLHSFSSALLLFLTFFFISTAALSNILLQQNWYNSLLLGL